MARKLKLNSPAGGDSLILKWPIATSEGKEGPEEIVETIRLICEDIPDFGNLLENHILIAGDDIAEYDYEETKSLCERFNKVIEDVAQKVKNSSHENPISKQASSSQLKHILQMSYNLSVKNPDKLNHYEPFSPEVYGETSYELVEQMIKSVNFTENDYFIDLGSGVGQVVLQIAAATKCKFCFGIEKADWPASYALAMEKEYRRWMSWYGKEFKDFLLEKGDFLHDSAKEKMNQATIVFVNNFAFGPVVDHELKQRFANCLKEGARIVSSKAFCPLNFRISERNLSDIGTIMQVEELSPLCGAVSWTGKPFAYYVHTIDRTKLEKYFQGLKNPDNKEGEQRRDRKGRPMLSIKERMNGAFNGNNSNSSENGKRKGRGGIDKDVPVLRAAKVLDFDSASNASSTNTEDSTISALFGATTRRQWNEYVKRPLSRSGSDSDYNSSAAEEKTTRKYKTKKLKGAKELNNGLIGKRKMRDRSDSREALISRKARKLRPRQTKETDSDKEADKDKVNHVEVVESDEEPVEKKARVEQQPKPQVVADVCQPKPESLDSLNLLHAHTVMSTSGVVGPAGDSFNYNDKRMAETSSSYFKPSVQKQTLSSLEKEAGFSQMIETMKQRFLAFLSLMQTPEYKVMLKRQIEQEKAQQQNLLKKREILEKNISSLQKDGVGLLKERLKELGIKADNPKDLMTQAKSMISKSKQLKNQTSTLQNQIQSLQEEQNKKLTSCYKKIVELKSSENFGQNGLQHQERILASVKHLQTELKHLKLVNSCHNKHLTSTCTKCEVTEVSVKPENKNEDASAEKFEMNKKYEALDTILDSLEKEVQTLLRENIQLGNILEKDKAVKNKVVKEENTVVCNIGSVNVSSRQMDCSISVAANPTNESLNHPIVTSCKLSTTLTLPSNVCSASSSSWKMGTAEHVLTKSSPRILPPGTKIDLKKPQRPNGVKKGHLAQHSPPIVPVSQENIPKRSKLVNEINTSLLATHAYTDFEKSAAEDLISLKDSIQSPVSNSNQSQTTSQLKTIVVDSRNKDHIVSNVTQAFPFSRTVYNPIVPRNSIINHHPTAISNSNSNHLSSLIQYQTSPSFPINNAKHGVSSKKTVASSQGSRTKRSKDKDRSSQHLSKPAKISAINSHGVVQKEISTPHLTYITTHNIHPAQTSLLPSSHSGSNGLVFATSATSGAISSTSPHHLMTHPIGSRHNPIGSRHNLATNGMNLVNGINSTRPNGTHLVNAINSTRPNGLNLVNGIHNSAPNGINVVNGINTTTNTTTTAHNGISLVNGISNNTMNTANGAQSLFKLLTNPPQYILTTPPSRQGSNGTTPINSLSQHNHHHGKPLFAASSNPGALKVIGNHGTAGVSHNHPAMVSRLQQQHQAATDAKDVQWIFLMNGAANNNSANNACGPNTLTSHDASTIPGSLM